MRLKNLVLVVIALFSLYFPVHAGSLGLHKVFTNNMVLQRDIAVPVWGKANPGDKISVAFAGQVKDSVADSEGNWSLKLDPLKASKEPQVMTVKSSSQSLEIKNILVGDVWLCSGQSNMAFQLKGALGAEEEIKNAKNPDIRIFTVKDSRAEKPSSDLNGSWLECSPDTIRTFSAVAYYFGKELNSKLNMPIGLITSAVGGSPAEAWTSMKSLESNPALEPIAADFKKQVEKMPELKKKYDEEIAEWNKLYSDKKPGDMLADGGKVPVKPQLPLSWENKKAPSVL